LADHPREAQGKLVLRDPLSVPTGPVVRLAGGFASTDLPSAIYLPSDRALVIPEEAYKAAGNLKAPQTFTHRFHVPAKWSESLEAILYAARWADLNALAAGRTEHNFDVYAEAFSTFFEGKRLEWDEGELVVRVASGARHGLDALSSGEKQVIIIVSELLRRWRPGSLVLIDEPESHMHPIWLAKLWRLISRWQRERGGQVILATQSTQLFGLAGAGSRMLLGDRNLA
jgi:predicted ATPase